MTQNVNQMKRNFRSTRSGQFTMSQIIRFRFRETRISICGVFALIYYARSVLMEAGSVGSLTGACGEQQQLSLSIFQNSIPKPQIVETFASFRLKIFDFHLRDLLRISPIQLFSADLLFTFPELRRELPMAIA